MLLAHRWYVILAFGLAGAVVGALLAYVWPSPYRASRELYVGLNVYQATADRNAAQHAGMAFVNVNDYKNWQMASLNSVVYMDPILDETLARLQKINPYWVGVSREQLAEMLHVYWRNAGKWRLVAEHPWPERAIEAVLTWQDVIVEYVHGAVEAANRALALDVQLTSAAGEQTRADQWLERLQQAQASLKDWPAAPSPASAQPLPPAARAALEQIVAPLVQADPSGHWMDGFPAPTAPASAYRPWVQAALARLDGALQAARQRRDDLQRTYTSISQAFSSASQASLGLSAELLVQKLSRTRVYLDPVRPVAAMMLIGAGLGICSWLAWTVLTLSRGGPVEQAARA